jgi:RHS repeat-associated protein
MSTGSVASESNRRPFNIVTVLLSALLVFAVGQLIPSTVSAGQKGRASSAPRFAPSQPVGNLSGTFAVDGNGSATYSIDIQVPPGTGGVAPSLQVTYDSHRSNGYLGMGWALNGISAITRCGANYRVDGYKAGVEFDSRDRFCLDGRRLIAVSGTYGADGTVYRTEIETWTVLTSHGSCGSGPCYFTATDKDGNSLSFGATTGAGGSRILAQGRADGSVRTWSIDSHTDLNGNATTVSYFSDSAAGEYFPDRIDYTSNARTGLAPLRSVQFGYESRPDVIRRYMGGSQVRISKLLTSITTHVSDQGTDRVVLAYKFAFDQSSATGRSRMSSATLCDGAGTCWPPTRFGWYTDSAQFQPSTTQLPGPTYVILDGRLYPFGLLMDLNGDGIGDYSQATEFVDGHSDLKVYLGHSDGSFTPASFTLPGPVWRVASGTIVQTGVLRDINGDGIADYSHALRNEDDGTSDYTVYVGTGQGFDEKPEYQLPGQLFWQVDGQTLASGVLEDMNGDGIPDYSRASVLLATGEKFLDIYRGTGSGFVKTRASLPGPLFAILDDQSLEAGILRDINGDGIADFSPATLNADSGQSDLRVFLGRSPDFTFDSAYSLPGPMLWVVNGVALETGALVDINGDGIPDYSRATRLESTGEEMLGVHLGTANGFAARSFDLPGPLYSVLGNQSYIQGLLTNWNGDGTTRYSRATRWEDGTENLELYLGGGQGFTPTGRSLPKAMFRVFDTGTYANAVYEDVNGDGLTDFVDSVCVLQGDGTFENCSLGVQLASGPFTDVLQRVTNGFNGSTAIEYAALTSGLYQPSGRSSYPIRDGSGSMIVVDRFTNDDGRGNAYSYSYQYTGAHIDALGYGWLGFETVAMTDAAGGRSSKITYEQSFPYYGLVASSQVRSGAGSLMAESDFSYADIASADMQRLGIHQPVRIGETYTQYTDNTANYTLKNEYQYDAYGNVTISSDLGDIATADDDVYSCVRYSNDPDTGRYGYVLQNKTEKTKEGCEGFVNATDPSSIAWDPAVDLQWSKTAYDARMNVLTKSRYDDSNRAFLTDTYTVDDYGNILTAANPAGDTTTYAYDTVYHTFRTAITSPPLTRGDQTYRLITSTRHEPGFGVLISTTDPNGNTTSQRIDGFGRPVEVYGPDDSGNSTLLVTTAWASDNGAYYLETRQRPAWADDDPGGWYWDRQYYDGLDRSYRTERRGLKNGQTAVIATDTTFDRQGRIYRTTSPYYSGDPVPATTTEYDDYNRPVLITDPAGVKSKIDYADGGLKVTRTIAFDTPDAQTDVRYFTGRGLVRQSVEPNGLTTTYVHDKLGQLTASETDPEQRSTLIAYDSLGRTRRLEHPDNGISTWNYDGLGYLRQTVDGAGNAVSYPRYDSLGRVRERSMSYAGGSSSSAFDYDNPDQANGLGNLTRLDTTQAPLGTFTYEYSYTAYGEAKAGTMTIAGDRYVYASSYDPMGRVVGAAYPDGTTLTLGYLTDENLGTVSVQEAGQAAGRRYLTYADYTALGQAQQKTVDPTGVVVRNTYYPLGDSFSQLRTTEAVATGKGSAKLYSRSYAWNKLNALTAVNDLVNPSASETYGYQDQEQNRQMGFLTSATGAFGSQGYGYDLLGNVQNKGDLELSYFSGKDLLAGTSAGTAFDYYGNGNQKTSWDGQASLSYFYDASGLLVRVDKATGSGPVQSGYMAYDANGRQVFQQRAGEQQKTYWITEHYEVVDFGNGNYQHSVYVPGDMAPAAAITRPGKGNTNPMAVHAALGELYGSGTLKGSMLSTWNKTLAALERHRDFMGFVLVLALAGLEILCAGMLYRRAKRMFRPGTAEHGRVWARVRPVFAASTPLVILCFLAVHSTAVFADLVPGVNGPGIPTAGYAFFLNNQLESTVVVTDESGEVTANVSYYPDGGIDQAHSSGTDNFRPKFIGREWDPAIALYHLGARYYSPAVGRFISPDPAGQFTSPYVYAGNSPVSAIDPDGEFAFVVALIIGAVVGAYFGGATVNHDLNPLHWNWRSGKTYAGLFGGVAIGSVGAAAGGLAVEAGAALGASGGIAAEAAGVAVGIGGQALVGAGENAAFTALGGGSDKEILEAAGEGALWGGAFAAGGEALGSIASQFARRADTAAESAEGAGAMPGEASAVEETAEEICGASFVAGTPVMADDGRTRPIEEIKAGDRVMGRRLADPADGAHPVTATTDRQATDFVTITFASGHSVTTTPEHPFKGYQRGWIPAKDLGRGDLLEGAESKPVAVASAERRLVEEPRTVYNFAVADVHDYRVSEDGVLVHNPKKKARTCTASIDQYGVVTETWSNSELQRRFPKKSEYQAIQRDIRAKARNANKIIKSGKVKAYTRVSRPVKTASKEWIRYEWKRKKLGGAPPTSIRKGLAKLRKHFANQDVDEYLTRIQGGLTIREGLPENQGPLNSFVNQTSGAAIGALARRGPPVPITRIRAEFVKQL